MKRWYDKMACVSCLALCLSCTAYKQPLDGERIAVEFHDDILKTSSFREGYELVALDAPCNEAVISSVDRLLFAEGRIVVLDQVGNKVLLFDSDGGFLKSTSKMVGKGHNEYIRISDAAIDESARKLYVHCDAPYQMMVFDWDLNPVKRFNLAMRDEEGYYRVATDCSAVYFCKQTGRYELSLYKADLNI